MLEFFETSTQNLLAAAAPGVRHYVALSVVGCDGHPDSGYLRAKVAQADLIENSVLPVFDDLPRYHQRRPRPAGEHE